MLDRATKLAFTQVRIAELNRAGLTNAQIAERLGISPGTVSTWLKRAGLRGRQWD